MEYQEPTSSQINILTGTGQILPSLTVMQLNYLTVVRAEFSPKPHFYLNTSVHLQEKTSYVLSLLFPSEG